MSVFCAVATYLLRKGQNVCRQQNCERIWEKGPYGAKIFF